MDGEQPVTSKRASRRKPEKSSIVDCGKDFYYHLNDLEDGEPVPAKPVFRRVKEKFDPVSSNDEFPRPLGPILKHVGKRPPKFQPCQEEFADESFDDDVPRTAGAKRTVKKKNPKLAKAMKPTAKTAAGKRAAVKKTVEVAKKARSRKATGVMEPSVNNSDELQAKSGESKSRGWWRNWITWTRSEKRYVSSDMMTQTLLRSKCLLRH